MHKNAIIIKKKVFFLSALGNEPRIIGGKVQIHDEISKIGDITVYAQYQQDIHFHLCRYTGETYKIFIPVC